MTIRTLEAIKGLEMSIEQDVGKVLDDELLKLQEGIVRNMERAGQVATGTTRDALEHSVTGFHGVLEGAPWTFSLERGRGPARSNPGTKVDFIEGLKKWIVAKGIPFKDQADLERLAKFFRWYVNKNGTRLFRSGGRTDIFTPVINEFGDSLAENLSNLYIEEVVSSL